MHASMTPGSGKTMLARRLPTILPMRTLEESLETTRACSSAGFMRPVSVPSANPKSAIRNPK